MKSKRVIAFLLVMMCACTTCMPALADTHDIYAQYCSPKTEFPADEIPYIYDDTSYNANKILDLRTITGQIRVKFDSDNPTWPSAEYSTTNGRWSGYVSIRDILITTAKLRRMLFSSETLQRGDRGQAVKWLQYFLYILGYNPNGIDGIWGDGTQSAVLAYQRDRGLTVDGLVGNATKNSLLQRSGMTEFTYEAFE